MWMIDSGQKVKTFNHVHGNAEVTSLAQDPSETRIFTGGSDGTIKVCRTRARPASLQEAVMAPSRYVGPERDPHLYRRQ